MHARTLGEFRARVSFLEREIAERDRRIEALVRQVGEQKAQIEKLIALIQDLQRSSKRQAAPFSTGDPKADPKRPGRKPGAQYGRRAERPIPDKVDVTYRVACPKRCPCGGRAQVARFREQCKGTRVPDLEQHWADMDQIKGWDRAFDACSEMAAWG